MGFALRTPTGSMAIRYAASVLTEAVTNPVLFHRWNEQYIVAAAVFIKIHKALAAAILRRFEISVTTETCTLRAN